MDNKVFITPCENYEENNVEIAMNKLLLDNNLLDFVTPGMKIGIKANLVAAGNPDKAVTTHYMLVKKLANMLAEKGAIVTIGDSPGGLFNDAALKIIYKSSKMDKCVGENIKLNENFNQSVKPIDGFVLKKIDITDWLFEQDVLINFCKIKSHGMMGLSASTKNMFGAIPGILKPEYHYRYPDHNDFSDMIIDIYEYTHPVLNIMDAVVGMEGNGPTAGTPRKIGAILASKNTYALDLVAAKLIDLDPMSVRTIVRSIEHGFISGKLDDILINDDIEKYVVSDFKKIAVGTNMEFDSMFRSKFGSLLNKIMHKALTVRPKPNNKECIGCEKCYNICPAKAITMNKKKPVIDTKKCIRCFCCQEFCPVGAMKTHKTWIAKILTKGKRKK